LEQGDFQRVQWLGGFALGVRRILTGAGAKVTHGADAEPFAAALERGVCPYGPKHRAAAAALKASLEQLKG
jgi:hypothetical protein